MLPVLEVAVDHLNLRSAPVVSAGNVLAVLNRGDRVDSLDGSSGAWCKVAICANGVQSQSGYACSQYLKPAASVTPAAAAALGWVPPPLAPGVAKLLPVNITGLADSRRDSIQARHAALSETQAPRRDAGASPSANVRHLGKIIDFLNVPQSVRYKRTPAATFCNVYAYDYCYLAGVYLPRVWWSSRALGAVLAARPPPPAWGTTVSEMTANALYDWLTDWGPELGWSRCSDLSDLQAAANGGGVGVICAKRVEPNLPGHITVVAPETDLHRATRTSGSITVPLQSQAGASNYTYFTDPWWQRLASRFRGIGFWRHS
jgi:hypothetical protein